MNLKWIEIESGHYIISSFDKVGTPQVHFNIEKEIFGRNLIIKATGGE